MSPPNIPIPVVAGEVEPVVRYIKALNDHIAKLEAQFDLLEAELTETKWLRAEEVDDLRKTIVMLWDVMRDDDCIRFSSISPVRYNTVNDLWQTWHNAQKDRA